MSTNTRRSFRRWWPNTRHRDRQKEHLVEEVAGILWRKRRLRLAEAAAHRRGLEGTLSSYRETVKVALVHLDATNHSERVVDAIRRYGSRHGGGHPRNSGG